MRLSLRSVCALIFLGLLETSALAVEPGATFNGWTYECRGTDQAQTCTFAFVVGAAETRTPLAKFTLGRERSTDDLILGALLPLGIAVGLGVRAQLDGQKEFLMGLQTCVPTGCLAAFKLTVEELQAFAAAETLTMRFNAFGRQEATVLSVPLSGIRDAMANGGFN